VYKTPEPISSCFYEEDFMYGCVLLLAAGYAALCAVPAPVNPQVDCSQLASPSQAFAKQLTLENREIFCVNFTDTQREEALRLHTQPDENGVLLDPNEAVQRVAMGVLPPPDDVD
jgi:hypothetical protein